MIFSFAKKKRFAVVVDPCDANLLRAQKEKGAHIFGRQRGE